MCVCVSQLLCQKVQFLNQILNFCIGGVDLPYTAPRGRKRKAINEPHVDGVVVDKDAVGQDALKDGETADVDATPILAEKKEKKPKKPLADGMKTGTYDDDEEARFLEGLEMFGRDWSKVCLIPCNAAVSHKQVIVFPNIYKYLFFFLRTMALLCSWLHILPQEIPIQFEVMRRNISSNYIETTFLCLIK